MEEIYTIEQFELDFEDAPNLEAKRDVLRTALETFDVSDIDIKETLLKYKEYLIDLRSIEREEEDIRCNSDIDNGLVELYTCIKEIPSNVINTYNAVCEVGNRYYIKVDDVVLSLGEKWAEVATDEMKDLISKMNPTIWVYMDNGIGTQKFREVLIGELNEYFSK
jgi:hypothetical protein